MQSTAKAHPVPGLPLVRPAPTSMIVPRRQRALLDQPTEPEVLHALPQALANAHLVCPSCREPLHVSEAHWSCRGCARLYPAKDGLPELMVKSPEIAPELIGEPGVTADQLAAQVAGARRAMERGRVPYSEHLAKWLPEAGTIAEVACGTAPIAGYFRTRSRKFLALDLDVPMLRQVKHAYDDVAVAACDAFSLPLADRSIDMYVGLGIFELDGARGFRGMREAARVLKPGGRLYVSVAYKNVLRRGGRPARWRGHDIFPFAQDEMGRLMAFHGFEVDELRPCSLAHGLGPFRRAASLFPALLAGERENSLSYRLFGPLLRPFANSLVCVATKSRAVDPEP